MVQHIGSALYEPMQDEIERQLYLKELHTLCYGLEDSYVDDNPMVEQIKSDAVFRPSTMKRAYQSNDEHSLLYMTTKEYLTHDVHKYTGYTPKDWLNLTEWEQKMLLKLIVDKKELDNKNLNEAMEDVNS